MNSKSDLESELLKGDPYVKDALNGYPSLLHVAASNFAYPQVFNFENPFACTLQARYFHSDEYDFIDGSAKLFVIITTRSIISFSDNERMEDSISAEMKKKENYTYSSRVVLRKLCANLEGSRAIMSYLYSLWSNFENDSDNNKPIPIGLAGQLLFESYCLSSIYRIIGDPAHQPNKMADGSYSAQWISLADFEESLGKLQESLLDKLRLESQAALLKELVGIGKNQEKLLNRIDGLERSRDREQKLFSRIELMAQAIVFIFLFLAVIQAMGETLFPWKDKHWNTLVWIVFLFVVCLGVVTSDDPHAKS